MPEIDIIALIESVMNETAAPGQRDALTQSTDMIQQGGVRANPSIGNQGRTIRIKISDGPQIRTALRNAGIPYQYTDDGQSAANIIFNNDDALLAAQQLLRINEEDVSSAEEEALFRATDVVKKKKKSPHGTPVGVTGDQKEIMRPLAGRAIY